MNSLERISIPFTTRMASFADLEAANSLLNLHHQHLFGSSPFRVDELKTEWQFDRFSPETHVRLAVDENGRVIGYLDFWDLMQPLVMMFTFMRIHPGVAVDEIAAALLAWSEDQAYQRIPLAPENARVALRISAHVMDTEQVKALEKASYRKVRRFWRMRIDFNAMQPEPAWPEGINVRNMLPGEERKAIQVLRDAFHDHWGHVDTPFEDEFERWQQMMHSGDWFDPSLWFFAMDGDEIAGFSYCRDHLEGYPDLGWVAQLGVLRPWRQRGLGLALLQHSFAELQRRGRQKVGLAVDTDSITGALRLYEKVGMIPDNQYTVDVFEKELRPGIDFTTH